MPPRAETGVRFQANRPEMSRKAVAQKVPFSEYRYPESIKTLKSGSGKPLFRGVLKFDDSALQADRDGVGAVIGVQLGENVLDVPLHGFFRDGELSGDLFVGIPA
jgi:hypothetical protein